MMPSRAYVQTIAGVVVVVFAVGIWSTGGEVNPDWLRFFSIAVLVATLALAIWNRFLWRLSALQRWGQGPVDIRGTWKGILTSFWIDPNTGKNPDAKTVYLVIRQTATAVNVVLLTDESKSVSSLGVVTVEPGQCRLDYMFLNKPASRVEDRSRMHHGSTSLDITGRPGRRLHGHYWTDRHTRGELIFEENRRRLSDDYEDAQALFGDR